MKSNKNELKKRGLPEKSNIEKYNNSSIEDLFQMANSSVAIDRSVAIILLRTKGLNEDALYIKLLLERLSVEKALYTKLEICKSLETGKDKMAKAMCNYWGKIGNNQHTSIPDAVSRKKSYPLPRDIISRTFGRMDKSVCYVLLQQLESENRMKICEAIDSIGYMVYYNPESANSNIFSKLKETFDKYKDDELIIWRITLCCSVFPIKESKELLRQIRNISIHPTIKREIERSVSLINRKTDTQLFLE